MPASPVVVTPGKKTRLYLDLRAAGTSDFDTPVWTEVGMFEEGEAGRGIEATELNPRIGRGLTMEAVSGYKPTIKGKLTRTIDGVATNVPDTVWAAILARCQAARLGEQILVAEVDGDIATLARGFMMWATVKQFDEKHGKDVIQADIEFVPGPGDTDGNTIAELVID